eukprot:CAMPEP_0176416634 /NCGR_PEP_ID=MMETSP0127-20121128/6452_1 /TAXON_ID=938130 /ORGANISM="Platyophrya macrostoma, Strain WH" /LENGTH=609 /DNA_ID=CAMNT_0017796725 /DNA_START=42 /DNA_END=1871 /DNA_ORIENTATION=+
MSLVDFYNRVVGAAGALTEEELEYWIAESDISRVKDFYNCDKEQAKELVKTISANFVDVYLNNANANEVPLRRKTKFCLILNNFALHKPVRNSVFNAIKNLSGIFEESMKREGTMPFDSELGRMSEHVLVLLMRVCQYKLKAAQVHEFAEQNTQFAVQLLLAILLKEPPYEFELRCNCISGLLGFTQPQAFFSADAAVEVQSCEGFTQKVDFSLNLLLRLQAVQVVNDVLLPQLLESNTVPSIVHVAVCNMMRCIMNIFSFCSQGATQWRQHILLSTTFLDGVTTIYLQSQVNSLQSLLAIATAGTCPVPNDLVQGVALALKFCGFATFHMGRHGRCVRPLCGFIHDLLQLSIRNIVYNPQMSGLILNVYTNLLHFLCNVDALAGDDGVVEDISELIPELTSENLKQSILGFLTREVAPCGAAFADAWHRKFFSVDTDALVAQENVTFQLIDGFFQTIKSSVPTAAPEAPSSDKRSLLGEIPSLTKASQDKKKKKKVAVEEAATVELGQAIQVKKSAATNSSVPPEFLCALSGNMMKNPMLSPYGQVFDRETIEMWLKQQGPVCPITGKPLSMDQLQVHKPLQQQIMQVVIQQSMQNYNQEDAADLYDF